jgi:hypothetical protein
MDLLGPSLWDSWNQNGQQCAALARRGSGAAALSGCVCAVQDVAGHGGVHSG